jgi:hypothetical protein
MIREFLSYRKAKRRIDKATKLDSYEMTRNFILDSRIMEAQQLSTLLGLPEVTAEAVAESEKRANKVAHLLPLVTYLAAALTTGVMSYYDTVSPWPDELNDEEKLAMQAWVMKVCVSCTLGALSQLEELELIEVTK